ncbi:MAG: ABC transporter permease [Acidobacteriaceae bacterium]
MSGLRTLMSRCAAMFRRRKLDREMDEELETHLAMAEEENLRRGMTPEAARLAALREFGGVTQVRETMRLREGLPFLENLRRDFAYALRQMRKSPGFAATVIGTLALGIGAAAAMFTVVDHVLLEPVPYRDAGRVVQIKEVAKTGEDVWPLPWLDVEQWRKQSQSFQGIAFVTNVLGGRHFLEQGKSAVEISAEAVSANLLPMLGVQPMLGRGFLPETPSIGPDKNAGTIVLSYAAWQAVGGRRDILGKTVRINDKPWTVIGVMPAGFRYPADTYGMAQVWTPAELDADDAARGNNTNSYTVVARLRPGVTVQAAQAEMAAIQQRVAQEWSADVRSDHSFINVERYADTLVDKDMRKALLALLAAAGALWLIASLNVTNLLLARSTARAREMAMRRALGASRWRIVRQMMVEGLALSTAAGALGIGLATASVKLLAHEISMRLPLPVPARPDTWILLALVGLTVASALVSTAWPALVTARAPLEPALKQGGLQTGQSRRHHRMRGALVALEIAMSLTLLMGCGLLLRTIYALEHVPLGFRTDHIVVAHLDIPGYRFANRNLTADLYEPVLERVQQLHGVESAGLMTEVPLGHTFTMQLTMYLKGHIVSALMKAATPQVQQVFGFPMAAGRFFDADDVPGSPPAVVVNEAFAREYSPDKHDPAAILGTKLMGMERGAKKADYAQVVGVLQDVHQAGIASPSSPEVEVCLTQMTPNSNFYNVLDEIAMDLAVRTRLPEGVIIPEIRDVLRQADPELAGAKITTMDEVVEDSYGSQRLAAHLLEIFGGSALLLCIAGLYGLLAYVVNQRTRELGVRIALGAPRANVLWLVLRQAGAMLLAGVIVGTGLALASGRLARGFLYGVKAHDGWTLAGAAVVLFVSGMLAAYLPARRAAAVDPMEALRSE